MSESASPDVSTRIKVHFRSVGQAPIMKKRKFRIESDKPFSTLSVFLRQALKLAPEQPLFLYVNDSFSPTLDQSLGTLHACFGRSDELIVNYGVTESWG